ncbi:NUDIX domain-containing protein [Poseidonocella sedimentorum]|uniref:ADP-ribose pyrophosphatase YjhB, NUDIX family n=1 Tax=Poseidonocella sedimentorum TaxID=871652 RepID=A0A1I6CSZ3_9RHOB|nr:NUDIX domain-containing protein [Poseidonocella sedimentorum]SFQ96365.1 ADP-ribose pyrophosphatase YjhB, NUDIX family [Poseidonocella sedimentorum]
MLRAHASPRLAVRGLVMQDDQLLIVNAWSAGQGSDLWCAPGGGAEPGQSLPENLAREIHEETGLRVSVGAPCLVNEYHEPDSGFHQVEVFFRCEIEAGEIDHAWRDPEGVVTERRFVTRDELGALRHKPDSLGEVAWGEGLFYDPLELLAR